MKFITNILRLLTFLALPFLAKAQVGDPAPNFTVTDTHGEPHTLYDYLEAGKVVVLDFFFTTCGPCQFYSPQVNLAYEKYGCNNAKVIFMSIDYNDNNAQVLAYDEQFGIEYPSVSGDEGGGNGVVDQYGIFGFPTFYVIDSSKTIIEVIDPPTLQVFDFRFGQLGIQPADCNASAIHETGSSAQFELSPNPISAGGNLLVKLSDAPELGLARFEILNMMGQTVQQGQFELSNHKQVELPLDGPHTGTFLLKISPFDGKKGYTGVFVVE